MLLIPQCSRILDSDWSQRDHTFFLIKVTFGEGTFVYHCKNRYFFIPKATIKKKCQKASADGCGVKEIKRKTHHLKSYIPFISSVFAIQEVQNTDSLFDPCNSLIIGATGAYK